ncbi:hypothetical protein ADS46_06000 [Halomonas sp. G11]|nr:hypothetical protein ADS46_06000 [Halomonas sp. G11]
MIMPEPPGLLQVYQPRMRYYLVDEGRYTDEQLGLVQSPLSGVFSIEKASTNRQGLQQAVDRIVAIIQADPHKERIDKIITRWLKRHLQRLGAEVDLNQLNSLVEDKDMLAENLENWAQQERQVGLQEGEKLGIEKGEKLGIEKTARNLLKLGVLSDEQIAEATGLALDEVAKLRTEDER